MTSNEYENDYTESIASSHSSKSSSKRHHSVKSSNSVSSTESKSIIGDVCIPKIIMQTWKNNKVPKKWRPSPESIQRYMPDWKHVLMTDDDNYKFIEEHFPDFLPYYEDFPYNIQRADAIRACWLYVHGGIYMDLDFEIQQDLSPLFYGNNELYFVASGNVGSTITNSFMASKPGNPFWLEYIEEMKKPAPSYAWGKHFTVMGTTGPIALNRIVRSWPHVIGLLPSKTIMPCSVCSTVCEVENVYLKPLEGGSWNGWDSKCLNFFLCNWRPVVLVVTIILLIIITYLIIRWRYNKCNRKT
jgi:mannosyltransferase OCH1-like enzyme